MGPFSNTRKTLLILRFAAVVVALCVAGMDDARPEPAIMRPDKAAGFSELAFATDIIAIARRDLGKTWAQMGLPSRLWCGFAMNAWRKRAGLSVPRSGRAIDHASLGRRVSRPVVGALMIEPRRCKRGKDCAHVSIITAVHADGTVTAISGNDGRRVRERVRLARGIIVQPT